MRLRPGMVALVCLATTAIAPSLHAETVLVLCQTAAQLTAVDGETGAIRGSLSLPKVPANVTASPDGTLVYVAHSDLGQISVVDLAAWRVRATLPVPGSPFGLAASASGKLYVGDWNGESISELDATSGQRLRSAPAGKAPAHLALTPDGTLLIAVAREANTVTIFDVATFSAKATLAVDRAPFALAVTHDGNRAIVANAQAGSISTIDLTKLQVTANVRVGAMPYGVAITSDDSKTLVTNQQSGTISVISGTVETDRSKVGNYPEGIAVSPGGTKAYVANWFSDDLSIIDIATATQTWRIKTPAGPRAIAVVSGSFGR